jgi:hypothetical protein
MSAWGVEAFANDVALDEATWLVQPGAVVDCLERAQILLASQNLVSEEAANTAYAAVEMIAASLAPEPYWQDEHTTLFDHDSLPYLPPVITRWLQTRPFFTLGEIELALDVIKLLRRPELLALWQEPVERETALSETERRLLAHIS